MNQPEKNAATVPQQQTGAASESEVAPEDAAGAVSSEAGISAARAALIRERIATGYYNDPVVVDALARKLVDRGVL